MSWAVMARDRSDGPKMGRSACPDRVARVLGEAGAVAVAIEEAGMMVGCVQGDGEGAGRPSSGR
jgi:hypothetical protein